MPTLTGFNPLLLDGGGLAPLTRAGPFSFGLMRDLQ